MAQTQSITIKGFESIRTLEAFALRPLDVLIGPNGAGKGNFIGALRFLCEIAGDNFPGYVQKQGKAPEFLHGGPKRTAAIEMEVYGFPNGPVSNGYRVTLVPTPAAKATHVEKALHRALVDHAECRPDRLLPHIQPYELEGLFFSSPERMAAVKPEWARHVAPLRAVREAFATPEHINDGHHTKPSARLSAIPVPRYRKTSDAPLTGERIGLNAITAECPHFAGWVHRLQSMTPL